MTFFWRESEEETCGRKNPYDKEYDAASLEFFRMLVLTYRGG